MSAQLTFAITNQIIKRTDHFRPAALSQNYLRAGFTFSEDWDDDATRSPSSPPSAGGAMRSSSTRLTSAAFHGRS